jgi:hypothetical protein
MLKYKLQYHIVIMMCCADWPHRWPGSTGPIHSWKRIGEILLLWSGNYIHFKRNCREINIYMYKNIIIIHLILHVFFLRSKNTNVCTKMYVHKCMYKNVCSLVEYCDVHFPLSAIPFFSRVSYLVGDNLCSPRQWQIIKDKQSLQSTSVADNYGQIEWDILWCSVYI